MTNYYLVSYDLNKEGQNYTEIENFLKGFAIYKKILTTTWIIRTGTDAKSLRLLLENHLDENDEVIVVECTPDMDWKFNLKDKNEMMFSIMDHFFNGSSDQ